MSELLLGHPRYQVLGQLGQGGMGTVLEAFDRRRERKVAIKVLRDPERGSLFRFKREFRAVADLRHPNLVRLYDLGVLPGGTFFFSMERVEGQDLGVWCRARAASGSLTSDTLQLDGATRPEPAAAPAGPPPPEAVAQVLLGVVEGLDFLHSARKVHRDLKPGNVLVEPSGRPRLLDFGILADLDDRGTGLTLEGAIGTPHYMAPEQVLGEPVGPPTDLYALGCLLYEVLAGHPPFQGAAARVLMRHAREDPQPPSRTRPCDPALERLCLALLQKEPSDRPDAPAVREALRARLGQAAPPPATALAPPPAAPGLLGREPELGRLLAAWEAAQRSPRLLLVAGESGSGKTALLAELAHRVQVAGARAWLGPCYEHEQVPYKAFDPLVDAVALALVERRDDAARLLPAGAASLVRLFPVLREVPAVAGLDPDTTLRDPRAERERAFRALLHLLTNLGEGRAPLLVLEDLQRADQESLETLRWLAEASDLPPCLIAGSFRREEVDAAPGLAELQASGGRVERLDLGPLPHAALLDLVAAWAPGLGAPAREALARDAQGSPFLAVELARAAAQDVAGQPAGITALVARRLAPLASGERGALEVAAAAGGRVGFGLLGRATGLSPAALSDALDELLRVQLLREAPGGLQDEAYGLGHDRLREAVYVAIVPERRRELHRALAGELMREDDPMRAVAHWRLAGEQGRAREAALAAAREAEQALAFDRAAGLYEVAAEQGQEDAALATARASALSRAGRPEEAARVWLAAAAASEPGPARELRLLATRDLLAAGDLAAGLARLDELLREVGDRIDRSSLGCYLSIAWRVGLAVLLWLVRDAGEWLRGGRKRRPAPDAGTEFRIRLYQTAHHLLAVPRPILAVAFGVQHELLVQRHEVPGQEGLARIGHAFLLLGAFGPAVRWHVLRHVHKGEALCAEAGEARGGVYGQAVRAFLAMLRSDWAAIRRCADRGDALARRGGLHGDPTLALLRSMRVGGELFSGNLPAAVATGERYLAEARSRGNMGELPRLQALQAGALLLQGEREAARRGFAEALERSPREPISLIRIQVEILATNQALAEGRAEEALRALEGLRARWGGQEAVATDMETALYAIQRELCRLALVGQGKPAPRRWLVYGRGFSDATTLREIWLRVRAAGELQAGRPWRALRLLGRSIRSAELHGSRLALAMGLTGRALVRERLGLAGAALDRGEADELFQELGVRGRCFLLGVEGWEPV